VPHVADVISERRGEVAWIRLNRPDRMNAYDQAMADELIHEVRSASDAGVIVITGSGRAFCAGGFLANLQNPDPEELRGMFYNSLRFTDEIRNSPRPVIAAVNGAAAGGGNELVIACDMAIAAESATFGQTGPKVGSAPVLGGTNLLAMQIGEKRAKEVSFICRRYSAGEALSWGWINAVVPDDQLEEEVTRWADDLLANSPRYLEIAKISSNMWWNACRDNFLSGLGMLAQAIGSEDMIEGATAFMEKRPAQWPGRQPRQGDESA
jgi:2-ketocyclohexanecarboxyl-CoA hydrolase